MTGEKFGAVSSSLDTPLIVVTAAEGRERAGCLVGFHSQASIEPLRLSQAAHLEPGHTAGERPSPPTERAT